MTYTISFSGPILTITYSTGGVIVVKADSITQIKPVGDVVTLERIKGYHNVRLDYTEITDPVYASLAELLLALATWWGSEAGVPGTTTGSSVSIAANYFSPDDFSATFVSASTLQLLGLPFIPTSEQLKYVLVHSLAGVTTPYINGVDGVTLSISSDILIISGVSPFVTGDIYEVGIRGQRKPYDPSTQSDKHTQLNTIDLKYTSPATLVTAQDLTASYADFGSEINMQGYNILGVYVIADCNTSEDVLLKVLGKHESGGTDEYEIDGLSVVTLWSGIGTDFKKYYEFDVGTLPIVQLQAIAGTLGTAGDLTIVYDKKWRS